MIAYLKGKIIKLNPRSVILLVGDVGYEVFLAPAQLQKISLEMIEEFFVHSHIKEDAFDLYGFVEYQELDFFKKLISVSGVGPKSALNVLGLASVDDLKKAISSEDPSVLQQVSGIGKKTAERLVVELKEKFINEISEGQIIDNGNQQVLQALISLGYKESEVRDIVNNLTDQSADLSAKIKEALKMINQ